MPNINKNIIMQAGAAVANATNKAAGLSAATPEPGSIISAIQLVNGGRTIGPDALVHFTESVRNKLLSLQVDLEPIQSGSGTPSPDNVRPISGRTGLNVYVSPTPDAADATTYAVDWTSEAGTVYGGTLDVVTGVLTVDRLLFSANTSTMNNTEDYPGWKNAGLKANNAKGGVFTNATANIGKAYSINVTGNNDILYLQKSSYNNMTQSQWIALAQDLQIIYELSTPITYQLTAQEVITLVGDNYIWSDSGDVTITE